MTKLMIITNDSSLEKRINMSFLNQGIFPIFAKDTITACKLIIEMQFDLIMIDYYLKEESGLAFYKALKLCRSTTPILMIGDGQFNEIIFKNIVSDTVDYIMKPFYFPDLQNKVNKLLQIDQSNSDFLNFDTFKVDVKKKLVFVKDQFVKVGETELRILLLLGKKAVQVVDQIKIRDLLEGEACNMTALYYVKKLQSKIDKFSQEAFEILIIGNQGYKLELKS